jgi:hypothetical protein
MERLVPFSLNDSQIEISADLRPDGDGLLLSYGLRDPRHSVLDGPAPGLHTERDLSRADSLWKTTCFEAFFGVPGTPAYWEFNLSGDGRRWNCYAFSGYRRPSPPAASQDFILERVTVTKDTLECRLRALAPVPALEASLCAVARREEGPLYFSVRHAGAEPDFHLRESFILRR